MLMENTLRFKDESRLKYVFDLKGSTVDRDVTGSMDPKTVLKDQNFQRACAVTPDLTKMSKRTR